MYIQSYLCGPRSTTPPEIRPKNSSHEVRYQNFLCNYDVSETEYGNLTNALSVLAQSVEEIGKLNDQHEPTADLLPRIHFCGGDQCLEDTQLCKRCIAQGKGQD